MTNAIALDPYHDPIYRIMRHELWWHGVTWTDNASRAMQFVGNRLLVEELTRWPDADALLRSGDMVIVAEDGGVVGEVPAEEVEPVQMSLI